MKHREIMSEILRCLQSIPGLRVERDRRQPEDDDELRDNGPLAILYSGERETVDFGNKGSQTWVRRWELKPIVTVLIADAEQDSQREQLEDIEAAFVDALFDSEKLTDDGLLSRGSSPDCMTRIRHPDEAPIGGMEMFLNLQYDR